MTTQLITSRPGHGTSPIVDAFADERARPQTPDYVMRRVGAVVVVLCSLLIASVVATAAVDAVRGLGGRPAAAAETATEAPSVYVAAPGDTIWSIAERFGGDVGTTRYVDALIAQNGGTSIQAGQAVRLP